MSSSQVRCVRTRRKPPDLRPPARDLPKPPWLPCFKTPMLGECVASWEPGPQTIAKFSRAPFWRWFLIRAPNPPMLGDPLILEHPQIRTWPPKPETATHLAHLRMAKAILRKKFEACGEIASIAPRCKKRGPCGWVCGWAVGWVGGCCCFCGYPAFSPKGKPSCLHLFGGVKRHEKASHHVCTFSGECKWTRETKKKAMFCSSLILTHTHLRGP